MKILEQALRWSGVLHETTQQSFFHYNSLHLYHCHTSTRNVWPLKKTINSTNLQQIITFLTVWMRWENLASLDSNPDIVIHGLLNIFSQMKIDWRIKHSSHNNSIRIIYLWAIFQNTQYIYPHLFPCMHFEPSDIVNTACIII